jgi:hypothetical protein
MNGAAAVVLFGGLGLVGLTIAHGPAEWFVAGKTSIALRRVAGERRVPGLDV